jgi:hypothetical protein
MASQLLTELEVSQRRFETYARKWYEAKGKAYPGDPAQPIVDAVRGNDGYADERIGLLTLTAEQVAKGIKPTR